MVLGWSENVIETLLASLCSHCNIRHLTEMNRHRNIKQDGRLAPAYFSPNYKYFDKILQTVKNETIVLNLVFKGFFTNINSTIDFCSLYRRVSRFSVENFLSQCAEKFREGTLLCFKKFLVPKNVKDKRERERERERERKRERERGHHDFPSKICCLTVPKNFVGETFCVSEKFWYRKMLGIREGGYHDFPSKLFFVS